MDTVAAIVKNAQRLLDDARLLAANGSYRTAESLAILSMEESGKACLVHWKLKGYLTTDIKEELRGHLDKQKVLRAYRLSLQSSHLRSMCQRTTQGPSSLSPVMF